MKKYFSNLLVIITFSITQVFAQPITVSGIVKIESGYPVPGVLIKGKKEKIQVLTDSMGTFKIGASPFSTLVVSYNGFKNLEIEVKDKPIDTTIILLTQNPQSNYDAVNSKLKTENFENAVSPKGGVTNTVVYGGGLPSAASGSFIPQFSHKEDTRGSRYLFDNWVQGFVVTTSGNTIKDNTLFNYDKTNGHLLITQDNQTAIELDRSQITTFTLDDKGRERVFENVGLSSGNTFCEVVAKGTKYNFYKLIKTKFIKSDYHTDGLTSTGNPYDEYVDDKKYYVTMTGSNEVKELAIKKKSIKQIFSNEIDKVNQYFSTHKEEVVDESYVKGLIDYLNNE